MRQSVIHRQSATKTAFLKPMPPFTGLFPPLRATFFTTVLDRGEHLCYTPPRSRATPRFFDGRIAQLVEQLTLNQRVLGSSPSAPTIESFWKIQKNPARSNAPVFVCLCFISAPQP